MLRTVDGAGPVAAEGVGEHKLLLVVDEVTGASVGAPECLWLGPGVRVWLAAANVGGNLMATEAPDADASGIDECGEHAATVDVELVAVRQRVLVRNAATGVAVGIGIAVLCRDLAGERAASLFRCVDCAAWRCVESVRVVTWLVHALDDIDLATCWPLLLSRHHPERWPNGAAVRHRFKVDDDQRVAIPLLRVQANPGPCVRNSETVDRRK